MPKLENFANRIEIDGVPYPKNELKPVDESGDLVSVIYNQSASNVKKSVEELYQLNFADWTDAGDTPYVSKDDLLSDMKAFFFRVVVSGGGSSDDVTNASNVTGATVTDALNTLDERELDGRIKVNQGNVATTLGGVIESNKLYFIDGIIDMTGVSCEVPATGITISGHGANISKLICADNAYTMFTSPVGGSGDFIHKEITVSVSGTGSKVMELKSVDGLSLIDATRVIFLNCTSRGSVDNYAQGTENLTLRIGGIPELEFIGVWLRGYIVNTSQSLSLIDGAYPLYKAGAGFVMNGRFRSNENVDLTALSSFLDFAPSNFANPSNFQLIDCLVTRAGVQDASDPNITPNISSGDLVSFWAENVGIPNTHVGGRNNITAEIETTISTVNVYEDLDGTWTSSDLQHFDSPANGQLRHLGNNPRDYRVTAHVDVDGGSNDEIELAIVKWDNSASSFSIEIEQLRVVNNFQGGRDVAFFDVITYTTLDQNDFIKLQIRNTSDTSDVTAELDGYFLVEER